MFSKLLRRTLLQRNANTALRILDRRGLDEWRPRPHIIRMLRTLLVTGILVWASPGLAEDERVCRQNALGSVACPGDGPRPQPRPVYRSDVQALDRVDAKADARREPERFVRSRETRRLGGTTTVPGGLSGPCRANALGNLHCR